MRKSFEPLEKDIQHDILWWLTMKGIYCWRQNSVGIWDERIKRYRKPVSRFQINGVSDVLGILPDGRFLAVEVKRPKNTKRTQEQNSFIENINKNGGIAFYATSLEEVQKKLYFL